MRALLDTHAFLWMVGDPALLGAQRRFVEDADNELLLSAGSAWEISIKHSLGRLELPAPPHEFVPSHLLSAGVTPLAIDHAHALRAGSLPLHHRDPFDRLLIAQAMELDVPVVTADAAFGAYDIEVLRI